MLDLHWGTLSGLKAAERPKLLRNVPEVNDVLEESIARIASHTGLTLGVEHVDRVARHLAQDMRWTIAASSFTVRWPIGTRGPATLPSTPSGPT